MRALHRGSATSRARAMARRDDRSGVPSRRERRSQPSDAGYPRPRPRTARGCLRRCAFFHAWDPRKMGRAYSPSRKPFLKRRGRCLRYLMRPVPVVRRPIAFTDQLSERRRGKGGRVSVRSGIVGGVRRQPSAIAVRFAVGGGIRRGTHSCACGRRGNRTRRRWTSGCGKHDVHTCWGIEDAMVSRVPGWDGGRGVEETGMPQ